MGCFKKIVYIFHLILLCLEIKGGEGEGQSMKSYFSIVSHIHMMPKTAVMVDPVYHKLSDIGGTLHVMYPAD